MRRRIPPRWRGALVVLVALTALGCASSPAVRQPTAPTATPTAEERVDMMAQHAIGSLARHVTASYDASQQTVSVTATVAGSADMDAAQEQVKRICLRAQAALWTSGMALQQVTVIVVGPVLDLYADMTIQPYGTARLTAARAAQLNWRALSADAAWLDYDSVWLRTEYNDAG